MKFEVNGIYRIGDDLARVLWVGSDLLICRSWIEGGNEAADAGPETSIEIEYAEEWFKPLEKSDTT